MVDTSLHFTRHAIDRFKERFSNIADVRDNPVKALAQRVYGAKPNRSFINNTKFVTYLYERYGYDDGEFEFRTDDDAVYVCRRGSLLTVYGVKDSIFGGNTSRFKRSKV